MILIKPTDLNTSESKHIIDNFFMEHRGIQDAFEESLKKSASNTSLFQVYQEKYRSNNILQGYETHKGYKNKSFYNISFLCNRRPLHALLVFIMKTKELYSRLPIEQKPELTKRIKNCILNLKQLPGFQLELDTFYDFCVIKGFSLLKFDLLGQDKKIPDMTLEKNRIIFDVECKAIDPLAGHPITLDAANDFISLLVNEEIFKEALISGNVVHILFNKKLKSPSKNLDFEAYTPVQLLQKVKDDPTIVTIKDFPNDNLEKLAKEDQSQSYLFLSRAGNHAIKLSSSVKNSHIDELSNRIKEAFGKNFNHPKIICLRPFGIDGNLLRDEEIGRLFHNLFINKQMESLCIVFPALEYKPTYNEGKMVGIRETTEVRATITTTGKFEKLYLHLFPWLTRLPINTNEYRQEVRNP